jgi:hypothetical protein
MEDVGEIEIDITDDDREPVQSPYPGLHPVPQNADVEPLNQVTDKILYD